MSNTTSFTTTTTTTTTIINKPVSRRIVQEQISSQTDVFGKTVIFRLVIKGFLQPEVYASFDDAVRAELHLPID